MKKKLLKKNPIETRKPYPIHIIALFMFFANSRFWTYIARNNRTDLIKFYIISVILSMGVMAFSLYKENKNLARINKILGVILIGVGAYGIWLGIRTLM